MRIDLVTYWRVLQAHSVHQIFYFAHLMEDSQFVPSYVQSTDYSSMGEFMVAQLKTTGEMNMQTDSDFTDVEKDEIAQAQADGKHVYASTVYVNKEC